MRKGRSKFEPSQPDRRRLTRMRDQHGRVWEAVIDIENGRPIGPLNLVGINPPLIPEQKYFRFPKLADGTFTIDYAPWIRDREDAKRTFESRRIKYARRMYGEQAGKMLKENPAELQHAVGIHPQPVEPVLAAASGNKWVLGLSDVKPSWADEYEWGAIRYENKDEDDIGEWSSDQLASMFPNAEEEEDSSTSAKSNKKEK